MRRDATANAAVSDSDDPTQVGDDRDTTARNKLWEMLPKCASEDGKDWDRLLPYVYQSVCVLLYN